MARKPSTSTTPATSTSPATHARAAGGTGRYVFCPGSTIGHDQVFLEILQGPKVRFLKCPIAQCGVKCFLRGPAWHGSKVGLSRAEARAANPNAFIF